MKCRQWCRHTCRLVSPCRGLQIVVVEVDTRAAVLAEMQGLLAASRDEAEEWQQQAGWLQQQLRKVEGELAHEQAAGQVGLARGVGVGGR